MESTSKKLSTFSKKIGKNIQDLDIDDLVSNEEREVIDRLKDKINNKVFLSRKLQKYNLLKDFRVSNGTTWKLSRSLVFWLRANESTNIFVDRSNNQSQISGPTGTGHLDTVKGPRTRFPFRSLNFNNKTI